MPPGSVCDTAARTRETARSEAAGSRLRQVAGEMRTHLRPTLALEAALRQRDRAGLLHELVSLSPVRAADPNDLQDKLGDPP